MAESQIRAGNEQFRYYPYSGMFHATRNSFWMAGVDGFTQPPAQNPDLFMLFENVEPIVQGTVQRRRGYTLFNNSFSPSAPYQRSYSLRNDALGLRRYVWDSSSTVDVTDEAGNVVVSTLFAPSAQAPFVPRMVLSRNFGYFTDGVQSDSLKWDGTVPVVSGNANNSPTANNLTTWGIPIGGTPASTAGPQYVGSATDVSYGQSAPSAWSNVSNVIGPPDGATANVTMSFAGLQQNSDRLQTTNFGFTIPNNLGPVTGIQVQVKGFYTGTISAATNSTGNGVALMKGGTVVGNGHFTPFTTSNSFTTVGGNNDLWGTSWAFSDFNASNFGVQLSATAHLPGDNYTLSIDAINVTVFFAGGSIAFTTNTTTTNIVLLSGRTYFAAFQNSTTLTTSGLTAPSVTTGPLSGNQVNLTNIPVSTNPQVDTVLILATADGNDQTTLYLVGTVANGVTTFTDTLPDSFNTTYTSGPTLLTSLLYQDTDINGQLHGIANNNPPPVGLNFPTKHKGRLYGAVGRALYFSKNLVDVTTANGLITSKWEEAWPATYQFDISETAETIQGLLSDGETLWIATERAIRRLVGDSPNNFQEPEIQFNETGLLTQDTWKIVFSEGAPVGTIWVTPDFRVMASDFNTYQDIGTPVQNILNTITADGVGLYNCHASFVSQGPFDLYMLYLSTNSADFPNQVLVYNLRTKLWFHWLPTDPISTSLFNINGSGIPQWLFATTNNPMYFWDQTTRQDRNNNTPVSYPVTMQSSWLNFGDETLLKALNQQIIGTNDTNLNLTVEGIPINSNFTSPISVYGPTPVLTGPLGGVLYAPLASSRTKYYWYRFTWTSPASTVQTVLAYHDTETIPMLRI